MGKDAEMNKQLASIRDFYTSSEVMNVMEDGKKDYPHEKCDPDGMAFELKWVPQLSLHRWCQQQH